MRQLFHPYILLGLSNNNHYGDVIIGAIASQITSLTIVYSTVYSDADQSKHLSSASLAFVRVIHRGPVNSPHKWPVTRIMFPFDDVTMINERHGMLLDEKPKIYFCKRHKNIMADKAVDVDIHASSLWMSHFCSHTSIHNFILES